MFALMVGYVGHNTYQFGCNQMITQRYMSLPGVKQMAHTSFVFIVGLTLLFTLCLYNGLLLFATYYDCDPLTTKVRKRIFKIGNQINFQLSMKFLLKMFP